MADSCMRAGHADGDDDGHATLYSDDFEAAPSEEDEEMEEVYAEDDGSKQTHATNQFDAVVGALEGLMMDPGFQSARAAFCQRHCHVFEDGDENKLQYTPLHQEFCEALEAAVEQHLAAAVPGFDMAWFLDQLQEREGELDAEVFDLLVSMSDFQAFKELMLAYKAAIPPPTRSSSGGSDQQQQHGGGGSSSRRAAPMQVRPAVVHTDEQEDGDVRPDLDNSALRVCSHKQPCAAAGAGPAEQAHRDVQ